MYLYILFYYIISHYSVIKDASPKAYKKEER